MNRKLLALAVTAAMAAPMAAQAAPTVYGQLNMSVDMVDWDAGDAGDDREVQVNSNSSRLGVKGEEALGNGYSAVYKAEWEVAGDITGESDLTGRDRYLGLKGNWGTVKLGAYDSPLKTSQGMVDQFNDMTYTDMGAYVTGENRLNNVIGYESPKIADAITVNVALQSGENTDDGDDDGVSLSVVFEQGGLYLAAALDNDIVDGNTSETVSAFVDSLNEEMDSEFGVEPFDYPGDEPYARDTIRLTGVYTMDALQLGAMVQTSEFATPKRAAVAFNDGAAVIENFFDPTVFGDVNSVDVEEQSVLLSAAYTAGKNVFKGQLVFANYDVDLDGIGSLDIESKALIVGMDHNFTQQTKAYVQLGLSQTEVESEDVDANVLTVGMQTKF